jgi:hypothetical protein
MFDRQGSFYKFKGTTPLEENKTRFGVLTVNEWAWSGQVGAVLQTMSPSRLFSGFGVVPFNGLIN